MIRAACAGLLILTACGSVVAQPVASMTAFDVASVKPDTVGSNEGPGRGREVIQTTPQNLTMRNIRLRSALQWACRPQTDQILGVTWLDAERYLILAKVGTPASAEQLRLMLQKLLIERFKLTLHRVTRELPAFVFAVDKSGPKFERSQEQVEGQEQVDGNMQYGKGNSVIGANATMSQFVDALTNPLHTVVLDETGLHGRYSFTLDLNVYEPGNITPEDMPAIVGRGSRDKLGLKLESRKRSIPILVIDHAEKMPAGN